MVDSFTKWMNDMCREYIDISTVLRIERCMLTREVKKGNVPSRESIHVYYQKAMRLNMSRQASLDQLSDDESASGSARIHRRRRAYPMESQDSTASRDSMSRYTEQCSVGDQMSPRYRWCLQVVRQNATEYILASRLLSSIVR
ncbi:Piezo-type mechanosensitive ion channel component 2 [Liparis tanakae]|uniref:Piezo-type mechanosensitive ion channel component 2 n=1 Tax=Liparis tanakae TaxID=230148 RepID=A0A4Z2JE34_9TELE|nr:Piezo-type mechanosensitive ion channel component 2 [Liparis tanakae]